MARDDPAGRPARVLGVRGERLQRLFERCYGPLWAYARRRVAPDDVEDVVAEVWAVAWRRIEDVPEGDRALPWLYGVARHVVANTRRARGRRARLVERLGREPEAGTDGRVEHPAVVEALARLRPGDREVLRLAAWEELEAAEIAVVLGCSPNAAALRLSRARHRLRAALTGSAGSRTGTERRVTDA